MPFDPDAFRRLVPPPADLLRPLESPPPMTDGGVLPHSSGPLGEPPDGGRRALPSDYKWLVDTYDRGSFGRFFRLFRPGAGPSDLQHQAERTAWALDYLAARGHRLPRGSAELLACGRSDNGDVAYWVTAGSDDPEKWTIALGEARGPLWEEFDLGLGEWLAGILSRRIRSAIFPKGFPKTPARFVPYNS